MSKSTPTKEIEINFHDNTATALIAEPGMSPHLLLQGLHLPPYKAVLLLIGGANTMDDKVGGAVGDLFNRAVGPALENLNAIAIDGGTSAGVMQLMGQGLANRRQLVPLVGIAPEKLVTYPGKTGEGVALEPHHTHFVLTAGDQWGDETATMFGLLEAMLNYPPVSGRKWLKGKTNPAPPFRVAILAGGGPIAATEVLRIVRMKMHLIVITGSGGLADEIGTAVATGTATSAFLKEVIDDGLLLFHKLGDPVKDMERLLNQELGVDPGLLQAWENFSDYDYNAGIYQTAHLWLQGLIIGLGIVSALLAVLWQISPHAVDAKTHQNTGVFPWVHTILLISPILTTALIAVSVKFKYGAKWIFLRSGAEGLKRAIYMYRSRTGEYRVNASEKLFQQVDMITRRVMQTEVHTGAIKPYDKKKGFPPYIFAAAGKDDGFTPLSPEKYINWRVKDQLNYYRRTATKMNRQISVLYFLIYANGAVATWLVLKGNPLWISVTTSLTTAIVSWLGLLQLENSLVKYNQGYTELNNIIAWWHQLPDAQKSDATQADSLVKHAEQIIQAEFDGWMQQMQHTLESLQREQEKVEARKKADIDKSSDNKMTKAETADTGVKAGKPKIPKKAVGPSKT